MPMNTYGLFIALAFSASFLYVHLRAPKIGIEPDRLLPAYGFAVLGGLLGGRLLYAIAVDTQAFLSNPLSALAPTGGGFAVYGGVLGGALAVGAYLASRGFPMWKMGDIAAPSVLIGMGVGRFGCFFAGCCHGAIAPIGADPVSLTGELLKGHVWLSGVAPFLTTEFEGGVARITDVPLYPTQIWSIVSCLSLAGLLAWLWPRRRFDGQIAALALLLEPPFRTLIEAFRADHRGYVFTWPVSERVVAWFPGMTQAGVDVEGAMMGLTTSQFIGLLTMVAGVGIYLARRHSGRGVETPLADDMLEQLA